MALGGHFLDAIVDDVIRVVDNYIDNHSNPCYAKGTLILTARGEVAVEHLTTEDSVVTAAGARLPVQWIGFREVNCRTHPSPSSVHPIRVSAGAFGDGLPRRDLVLSPEHAIFRLGVLIPIRHLVNGTTIVQEEVETVSYWHVELPRHDVILAEGLPAESWLDTGNRRAFKNAEVSDLHPDFEPAADAAWQEKACAPLATGGAVVDALRAGLANRAILLSRRPAAELVLTVTERGRIAATLPANVAVIRVVSDAAQPAGDRRQLGVAVSDVVVDGVTMADAAFGIGFHAEESADGRHWRWTDGDAVVTVEPADQDRSVELWVTRVCETAVKAAA